MTFHWSADYLKTHGRPLYEEGSIEIHNAAKIAADFQIWAGALIHEAGHSLHYRSSPEVDQAILTVFQTSKGLSCYTQSRDLNGAQCKSYAIHSGGYPDNQYREFFACGFASYFNLNNFRPFTRDELRRDDPRLYCLLKNLVNT